MSSELAEHLASFKSWCAESKKVYGSELEDDDYVFITANLEPISSSYIVKMFNALKNRPSNRKIFCTYIETHFCDYFNSRRCSCNNGG